MQGTEHRCLLISGLDPTGGAGLLADYITCKHAGVTPVVVVSANTIQSNTSFYAVQWTHPEWMKEQIKLMMLTYPIEVVKIGIIEKPSVLLSILEILHQFNPNIKVVWDPIQSSTSGFTFYNWQLHELQAVLPYLYVITPNRSEFDSLRGSLDEEQAIALLSADCSLLIKSYLSEAQTITDLIVHEHKQQLLNHQKRNNHNNIRGTGCRLSSGIAAYLTNEKDLIQAYKESIVLLQQYVQEVENIRLSQSLIS